MLTRHRMGARGGLPSGLTAPRRRSWGAERHCANDAVEAGIALLDRLQDLDDVLRLARKPLALTASSIVGSLTVPTSRGSRIAAICSSLSARTRRNSPNIFMFSS